MPNGRTMLPSNEIESELSYAYLHSVASHCGFECRSAGRHSDNAGIDADIKAEGVKLEDDSLIASVHLQVQLKATFQEPAEFDSKYSYSLTVPRYDKLRATNLGTTRRIMVVLYLPRDPSEWITHAEDGLIAKRCAYWVSLYGAPGVEGQRSTTIYIPRIQTLSAANLRDLMVRTSRCEVFRYAG